MEQMPYPAPRAAWTADNFDGFHASLFGLGNKLVQRIGGEGSAGGDDLVSGECSWPGHCQGASCKVAQDCADALKCVIAPRHRVHSLREQQPLPTFRYTSLSHGRYHWPPYQISVAAWAKSLVSSQGVTSRIASRPEQGPGRENFSSGGNKETRAGNSPVPKHHGAFRPSSDVEHGRALGVQRMTWSQEQPWTWHISPGYARQRLSRWSRVISHNMDRMGPSRLKGCTSRYMRHRTPAGAGSRGLWQHEAEKIAAHQPRDHHLPGFSTIAASEISLLATNLERTRLHRTSNLTALPKPRALRTARPPESPTKDPATMPAFQSKKFRGAADMNSIGMRYRAIMNRHPFLMFGLPFMTVIVAGSFVLTPATAVRYERYDRKVRQLTKDEELNVRRSARKVDMKEEYYRLAGKDIDNWEQKRVERLPGENDGVL
ncbi:hypothetical protein FZEAL_2034 [Fusarium zealandicum]|uniref:Cytochrome c oxidase assembly protein COX16, mitochondrial n=1 Tax=Fusarium zealandicum TaxID=1053134 RepID=A0A8H4URM1_9HYPO|nr:hypothetical protein FZEAL_2034 [Fusarium zealandicum]